MFEQLPLLTQILVEEEEKVRDLILPAIFLVDGVVAGGGRGGLRLSSPSAAEGTLSVDGSLLISFLDSLCSCSSRCGLDLPFAARSATLPTKLMLT